MQSCAQRALAYFEGFLTQQNLNSLGHGLWKTHNTIGFDDGCFFFEFHPLCKRAAISWGIFSMQFCWFQPKIKQFFVLISVGSLIKSSTSSSSYVWECFNFTFNSFQHTENSMMHKLLIQIEFSIKKISLTQNKSRTPSTLQHTRIVHDLNSNSVLITCWTS